MGYFEGLVGGAFKKDTQGRAVFYPMGVLAKGRVLPDDATEQRVRRFMVRYYMVGLPVAVLAGAFGTWLWVVLALAALAVWFVLGLKGLLENCPVSDEKLTLKEGYRNSAVAHNPLILQVLCGLMVLFAAMSFVAAIGNRAGFRFTLVSLGMTVVFAALAGGLGYMLRLRRLALKNAER